LATLRPSIVITAATVRFVGPVVRTSSPAVSGASSWLSAARRAKRLTRAKYKTCASSSVSGTPRTGDVTREGDFGFFVDVSVKASRAASLDEALSEALSASSLGAPRLSCLISDFRT
jgi:hypothetical protein